MSSKRAQAIPGYLDALDGIRAIAVIMIVIFHNWQQSWIGFDIKIVQFVIPLAELQRYGYLALEMFFVMSGFCLMYPVARHMLEGAKDFDWKDFFIKRARRILPSYYFALAIMYIFPILGGGIYKKPPAEALRMLFACLTFTHNFWPEVDGAMVATAWTLAVEVQFYLLFPLFVWCFKKRPVLTFVMMSVIGNVARYIYMLPEKVTIVQRMAVLGYIDMFALGMIGAYVLVYLRNHANLKMLAPMMTMLSIVSTAILWEFIKWLAKSNVPNLDKSMYWQTLYRYPFSFAIAIWIVSTCLASPFWAKKVFGNKVMIFFSTISYNLFLWHQNINIFFRRKNIPFVAEGLPQNNHDAMIKYMCLTLGISILVSVTITYAIELPFAKYSLVGICRNIVHYAKEKLLRRRQEKEKQLEA